MLHVGLARRQMRVLHRLFQAQNRRHAGIAPRKELDPVRLIVTKLLAGGASAINSRKFPTVAGTAAMALATLVAALTPNNTIAITAISVTMFFAWRLSFAWISMSLTMPRAPPEGW